jgi:hypothetical protein
MTIYSTKVCRKKNLSAELGVFIWTANFFKHVVGELVQMIVGKVLHGCWENGF